MTTQINDRTKQIMDKYQKGDYSGMTLEDIKMQINEKGDTIIHWLAEKGDAIGLTQLLDNIRSKSRDLLAGIVNQQNKEGETPLHKAKENAGDKSNEVIEMLVNKYNANPNIPDKKDRIIIKNSASDNNDSNLSDMKQKTGRFTDEALDNIKKLSGMAEGKIQDLIGKIPLDKPESNPTNSDIDKIKQLIQHYANKKVSTGGYSGQRRISPHFSEDLTESGVNDSFVSKKKHQLMNELAHMISTSSQERIKRDPKVTEKYKEIREKIMELLEVDEETARIYSSALKYKIGQENPELRKPENDALRAKELEKLVKDKKTLQKAIKDIDIEEVKKVIKEQREQSEERRKLFLEKRKERGPKNKKERKPKSESTEMMPNETSSEPEEKPKAKRGRKKAVENGYLQSDEIIFSPGI